MYRWRYGERWRGMEREGEMDILSVMERDGERDKDR